MEDNSTLLDVTEEELNIAYTKGTIARNNLTTTSMSRQTNNDNYYKHIPKVCCFCDRFIQYREEQWIHIEDFQKKPLLQNMFHKEIQKKHI